jgi:hypothetical protein
MKILLILNDNDNDNDQNQQYYINCISRDIDFNFIDFNNIKLYYNILLYRELCLYIIEYYEKIKMNQPITDNINYYIQIYNNLYDYFKNLDIYYIFDKTENIIYVIDNFMRVVIEEIKLTFNQRIN